MDLAIEKQNLLQWIQSITDDKTIKKISIIENNDISYFENQLIQEGLEDIKNGNVSSHEEVKKRFEERYKK